jgi:ribonuclease BN (tRNA processing enzyme)
VRWQERVFCYITDNELFPVDTPSHYPHYVDKLAEFVAGADILTIDTTYLDAEYARFAGWGHSATRPVVELAARAGVKHLHLFHHDPSQDDDAIDAKLAEAQRHLQELDCPTRCLCAAENGVFTL